MTTALYIPRRKFHGFYDGHQFHRLDATATKTAVPEILRGVIIAEVGPFNEPMPRGQFTAEESLPSIVAVLKRNDISGGTLCEFDHGARAGALVGRIKNPRLSTTTRPDGTTVACVRGDLCFAPAARRSPTFGDLPDYIWSAVEFDNQALMLSCVISPREIPDPNGGPNIWLAKRISQIDIVSSGAATSSMLARICPQQQRLHRLREMRLVMMKLTAERWTKTTAR
jgi:hypothetical protein